MVPPFVVLSHKPATESSRRSLGGCEVQVGGRYQPTYLLVDLLFLGTGLTTLQQEDRDHLEAADLPQSNNIHGHPSITIHAQAIPSYQTPNGPKQHQLMG